MTFKVKSSNVWRRVNRLAVKYLNLWSPVKFAWIKKNNAWKIFYVQPLVVTLPDEVRVDVENGIPVGFARIIPVITGGTGGNSYMWLFQHAVHKFPISSSNTTRVKEFIVRYKERTTYEETWSLRVTDSRGYDSYSNDCTVTMIFGS